MTKPVVPIYDVFQPGLIRGAASLVYAPHKHYFYVEHPTEGWRVYLRSACFINEQGHPEAKRFLVVKAFGADPKGKVWEAPKGQMEGKDGLAHPRWPIIKILEENVLREVEEEAKVRDYVSLKHTGLVLQNTEPDYPPNTYFQYHVSHGVITSKELENALAEFEWLNAHPKAFARVKKDKREKDELAWFDPRRTRLMGRWSPTLVPMYLAYKEKA